MGSEQKSTSIGQLELVRIKKGDQNYWELQGEKRKGKYLSPGTISFELQQFSCIQKMAMKSL